MRFFRKKNSYLFSEPGNTACFTCAHVLEGKQSVLHVTRDLHDGSWQFLCGKEDHAPEDARVVSLQQMVDMDDSLNLLNGMPLGAGAERESRRKKWVPFRAR